jgi:glycosyltransferase involved in cell wall biosynthesis
MRILLVSHKFPPHALGGVEVYTHRLAQALSDDHEVAVLYRHDDPDGPAIVLREGRDDGFTQYRIACHPRGLAASVVGEFFDTFLSRQIEAVFRDIITQFRPDVIHFQHVATLSVRILTIAHRAGIPVILTLHDYWYGCSNSQLVWPDGRVCLGKACGMNCVRCAAAARFPSPLVNWVRPALAPLFIYRDRVVRRAALCADQYISPSRFLADWYLAAGFPKERFMELENGIAVGAIQRFAWHPSEGPLRIVFLGSLAWQKGAHILADALRRLPSGAACLRIWGDPTVFPDYSDGLRRTLTDSDAQLMGPVPNELVGQVLADADVLVVPSLWYENSPVVIQEARAAGVPVVASGHGALAEKVRHEVDGLLFPPGNVTALAQALQRLVDEPDLLAELRKGVSAPMDMAEHARQLETIYRSRGTEQKSGHA